MKDRTDLYEITLILTEGEKVSDIEKIIKEFGEIKKSTDLQVKQFAYPIGKLTSGHYYATEFVADGANISKIAQELKAEKSIIRYLITKALRKGPEPIRTGEWAKKPEAKENDKIQIKNVPPASAEAERLRAGKSISNDSNPKEEKNTGSDVEVERSEAKIEEPIVEEPVKESGVEAKSEVAEKVEITEPKVEAKPEAPKIGEKLVVKKPRTIIKRPKAEKVSADELDKRLEELVKE